MNTARDIAALFPLALVLLAGATVTLAVWAALAGAPLLHWQAGFDARLAPDRRERLAADLHLAGYARWFTPVGWLVWCLGLAMTGLVLALAVAMVWHPLAAVVPAGLGLAWPAQCLREARRRGRQALLQLLPDMIDLISLCIEGGQSLQAALLATSARLPPSLLRDDMLTMIADIRTGMRRADALAALAARLREPAFVQFARMLIQAESLGARLGPMLRAQADQCREIRYAESEQAALEAPLRMLLPLLLLIFPCTFIVLALPLLSPWLTTP